MKVHDLITLLQDWENRHGPNAQIAVPRSKHERDTSRQRGVEEPEFGERVFLYSCSIATYLDSRGPEIEW